MVDHYIYNKDISKIKKEIKLLFYIVFLYSQYNMAKRFIILQTILETYARIVKYLRELK